MRPRLCLLVLPLLLVSCGDDDGDPPAAGSTTTTVRTTSTTAAAEDVDLGAPVDLGPGVVMGVHTVDPLAYVSVVVPGELGCEGGDAAKLVVQPVAGGKPVDAGTGEGAGAVLPGGDNGRVLIVEQCEGFLSSVRTALPENDGTLADARTEVLEASSEDRLVRPGTVGWSGDGRSIIGIEHDDQRQVAAAVRFRSGAPARVLVEDADLLAVAELADGTLVTATERSVTIGDGEPVEVAVTSLAVAPDGERVAVFGEGGVVVLEAGRPAQRVDGEPASVGSWSPDGGSLAYLRLVGNGAAVWLTELDGGTGIEVAPEAGFGEPRFTADGRTLVFNAAVDSGEGYDEPRATARRIRA